MKKEELNEVFDRFTPSDEQKDRMLCSILKKGKKVPRFSMKHILPLSAAAAVFLLCGLYLLRPTLFPTVDFYGDSGMGTTGELQSSTTELATVLMTRIITEGKIYSPQSAKLAALGYPEIVDKADLGEPAAIDEASPGELVHAQAFHYPKAPGDSAIAVEYPDGQYRLFLFENFVRYEENGEMDAADYCDIYGVHSGADIAEILVYYEQEAVSVTDSATLESFYQGFLPLTDASADLFDWMDGDSQDSGSASREEPKGYIETAPHASDAEFVEHDMETNSDRWYKTDPAYKPSGSGSASASSAMEIPGSPPAARLQNCYSFTVRFTSGFERSYLYYPDAGFFGRYQADGDFANLLNRLTALAKEKA